ncbi:hypothetical protein ACJ73_09672 [Blastomyces percursus]|uniref:DAGKc domain-containing protein n=1 Tax=Blastomyces percursus TaxID=1658174 RepID=A0A1J9Q6U0_9EURO|nr:hypothetical protein ACJ73_09672 [Blastomyces percursus]
MSIPSLGTVDINHVSYDAATNSLTWTMTAAAAADEVGEEDRTRTQHVVSGERIVAVVPCTEGEGLMSYIWLEDSDSDSESDPPGKLRDKQDQPEHPYAYPYVLRRFEAGGECPAALRELLGGGGRPQARPDHLYPAKSPPDITTPTTAPESTDPNNLHIIISTLSGTHQASTFYTTLLKPLLATLHLHEHTHYTPHPTTSPHTITHLTRTIFRPRARRGIAQTIILLAGDGGLVEIIKSLTAESAPATAPVPVFVPPVVALVPMGTGNATAHSAGVIVPGRDETVGLRGVVGGLVRPLPVFAARVSAGAEYMTDQGGKEAVLVPSSSSSSGNDGSGEGEGGGEAELYGAVVLSWGMHASLVADSDTPEYRRFGRERFQMAAKELLFPAGGGKPHVYRGRISVTARTTDATTGGETLRTRVLERSEHMYVLVTLCSTLEKGFTISPSSRPLDGKMWFVHFGPMEAAAVMEVMQLAYDGGRHVVDRDDVVGYEEVEAVRIEFCEGEVEERWRRICIDGMIVAVEDGGWVEVRKAEREVVRLVVPAGSGSEIGGEMVRGGAFN